MGREKIFRLIISVSLLANLFFAYATPVLAQTKPGEAGFDYSKSGVSDTIKQFLCAPTEPGQVSTNNTGGTAATSGNAAANDLNECINKLYKFAIAFASVIAVFFIVIGGYIYMSAGGNQESVDKAKNILETSVTALVILLGAYVLLRAINPDLIRIPSIQPPEVKYAGGQIQYSDFVYDEITGTYKPLPGGGGGGSCVATERGSCTQSVINQCPQMAVQMNNALKACNLESHGDPAIPSGTDKCTEKTTGKVVSFSWGIWQINITNSYSPEFPDCAGVLSPAGGPWNTPCLNGTCGRICTFGPQGEAGYIKCTREVIDPNRNTRQACTLFKARGWNPWPHTRDVCGLPK